MKEFSVFEIRIIRNLKINTAVHVVILAEINVNMFDIPEYGYKSEKISCIIPHADFSILYMIPDYWNSIL